MAVVVVRRSTATSESVLVRRADAGADAGDEARQETVTVQGEAVEAGSGEGSKTGAEWPYSLAGLGAVALYWFLLAPSAALKPAPAVQLAEGVAAFALFYVATQAIERLLEPIASLDPIKAKKAKVRDEKLAAAARDPDQAGAAATAQGALDQWRANRSALLWAAATILGMLASAKLGLYFVSALVEVDPDVQLDILITGLAIGGGTKPLHDLITRVQASSNNESDKPVVT